MKKLNKKIVAIVGTSLLAVGLVAFPALADSSQDLGGGWFSQMQTLMNQNFSPAEQQEFMSSQAMQDLHSSPDMQQAMQSQDFGRMQSLMNSDRELKAQIGAENVAKMNQMMGQFNGKFNSSK
ncbi:hypothetical protein JCM15765_13680 [Paradesulfitobacterium aromaticivorans]